LALRLQSVRSLIPPWYGLVLIVEAVTLAIFSLPVDLSLNNVAFGDLGVSITVHDLLNRGYTPGVSFGYPYGTLSLLFGRLWFGSVGATPKTFYAGVMVLDVLFAWGLARCVTNLRLKASGIALILILVPMAQLSSITFAHCLERVLLCWALAEHARNCRGRAMVLATSAIFVKPSMGFVYAGILFLLTIRKAWQKCDSFVRAIVSDLAPAIIAGACLFSLLSAVYGMSTVMRLLLPVEGAAAYRDYGFGFFGREGRTFWYFPGVHLGYYVGTPVLFWFVATALISVGAGVIAQNAVRAARRGEWIPSKDEVLLSCAIMHLAFVLCFFGSNASWVYYIYVLVIGVAVMTTRSRKVQKVGWTLVVLGLLSQASYVGQALVAWRFTAPSSATAELWAPLREVQEWKYVCEKSRGKRVVALTPDGAVQTIFGGFGIPDHSQLMRGETTPRELRVQLERLYEADFAVIPGGGGGRELIRSWPELKRELSSWRVRYAGKYFTLYEKADCARPCS
jgi:hypothetical protein